MKTALAFTFAVGLFLTGAAALPAPAPVVVDAHVAAGITRLPVPAFPHVAAPVHRAPAVAKVATRVAPAWRPVPVPHECIAHKPFVAYVVDPKCPEVVYWTHSRG